MDTENVDELTAEKLAEWGRAMRERQNELPRCCVICSEPFLSGSARGKYCSVSCRKQARRDQQYQRTRHSRTPRPPKPLDLDH